jgi:hypothetical protein
MKSRATQRSLCLVTTAIALALAGMASAKDVQVSLSGDQEIPPAATTGSGSGTITINDDKSVSGKVTITGVKVNVVHIHEAAAGKNGPIIIPLSQSAEGVWVVPPDTRLTDAQFESYKAGNLYVNVHSDAYKGGEVRGQIRP